MPALSRNAKKALGAVAALVFIFRRPKPMIAGPRSLRHEPVVAWTWDDGSSSSAASRISPGASSDTAASSGSGSAAKAASLQEEMRAASAGKSMKLNALNSPESWTMHPAMWTPFHDYVAKYRDACAGCPLVHKWEAYFAAYHTHFARFRGKDVTMMEVGVQSGGSILMWRWYFGDKFKYVGVDVNPLARQFETGWAKILIGDQSDPAFWDEVAAAVGRVDIFLDDGGHTMDQQRVTFDKMYPHVDERGVYACEDLATSYVRSFGGAPAGRWIPSLHGGHGTTFLDFTKSWVDWVNAYFVDGDPSMAAAEPSLRLHGTGAHFARTALSVHYYQQIVVVEKGAVSRPGVVEVGDHRVPALFDGSAPAKKPISLDMLPA